MRITIRKPDPDSDMHAELILAVINDIDVKLKNAALASNLAGGLEQLFGIRCEVEVDFEAE